MLLRVLLVVEEYFEDICLRGRQGIRPHHGLDVFLQRFSFLWSVLDGSAADRLGFRGLLALLLVEASRLLSSHTRLGESLKSLVGGIAFFIFDAAYSVSVFCERL